MVRRYIKDSNGTIEHYQSGLVRGGLNSAQACNTLFQGLGALVTKDTGWHLYKAGLLPVLFVHDEYICEVPITIAKDASMVFKQILEDTARKWLPDVGCKCEPMISTKWEKG
jgi:hypothetical protein